MKLDYSRNEVYLARAVERLGAEYSPKECHWLSILSEDGELAAVWIFCHFSSGNAEVSFATFRPHAWSRKILRDIATQVFLVWGLRRVTGIVHPANARSQQVVLKFNFKLEGLCRGWFPDAPGLLYGLVKEDCKWLC